MQLLVATVVIVRSLWQWRGHFSHDMATMAKVRPLWLWPGQYGQCAAPMAAGWQPWKLCYHYCRGATPMVLICHCGCIVTITYNWCDSCLHGEATMAVMLPLWPLVWPLWQRCSHHGCGTATIAVLLHLWLWCGCYDHCVATVTQLPNLSLVAWIMTWLCLTSYSFWTVMATSHRWVDSQAAINVSKNSPFWTDYDFSLHVRDFYLGKDNRQGLKYRMQGRLWLISLLGTLIYICSCMLNCSSPVWCQGHCS